MNDLQPVTADDLQAFADRLRARRDLPPPAVRRALRGDKASQGEIARALGVSTACVSRWESGTRTPRGELLLAYLRVLRLLAGGE